MKVQPRPATAVAVGHALLGALGSAAGGYAVFRQDLFSPGEPPFQCLTVGTLAAMIFTLIRMRRPGQALVLAVAFGMFQLGLVQSVGWIVASSGLVLGCGVFVVGLAFDLLAERGARFGKFLITGPLFAGIYLAAAPLMEFAELSRANVMPALARAMIVGLVMGEGVGLGAEIGDLLFPSVHRNAPQAADPI